MDIKELAKKLCDESGCHHKCKEIDECVVMEEAELLINGNKTIPKMFTVDVCNNCALLPINENKSNNSDFKSNNFDVKSNNELFKQALVEGLSNKFDKTIEEAKQNEQIEEMATTIYNGCSYETLYTDDCLWLAQDLYNAGYRKQSEGEWLVSAWDNKKQEYVEIPYIKHEHISPYCSLCGTDALLDGAEFGVASNYCPNCGARMKGGE